MNRLKPEISAQICVWILNDLSAQPEHKWADFWFNLIYHESCMQASRQLVLV